MNVSSDELVELANRHDFEELFVKLGWNRPPKEEALILPQNPSNKDDEELEVRARRVALMPPVSVWHCEVINPEPSSEQPADVRIMDWTNRQLNQHSAERILCFTRSGKPQEGNKQIWVWADPKRTGGYTRRRHDYTTGKTAQSNENELFCQRLKSIAFSQDEQSLGAFKILQKVQGNFDTEKVTSRFFTEFEQSRNSLESQIQGILNDEDGDENCRWYSVLLLNRLMFLYFIQKKGFLNNDRDYLRKSLGRIRGLKGTDQFYGYYRDFLLPIFHQSLGKGKTPNVPDEIKKIIGDLPYINGGIFMEHPIEEQNQNIQIPDSEFEKIFTFFDQYSWHLDDSPNEKSNEINPDTLGHIFEKYINQKEQGAYYTKEDIVQYMCSKTISPLFIDRLQKTLGNHEPGPWILLKESPHAYIPKSLFYGERHPDTRERFATWEGGRKKREKGVKFPDPLDPWLEEKHNDRNTQCEYRLPGETRREALERLEWARSLEEKLENGQVTTTEECITLNLELTKLVLGWIRQTNSPEFLLTAWKELEKIKILDPTVGSGAFLRVALDIVEDFYEAIFERAEALLVKEKIMEGGCLEARSELEELLNEIKGESRKDKMRSTEYFIRRTAILNNLYGNELNQEAAETCQLRLFLALAAALEDRDNIEPLPDLEFNIRTGNLLVGVKDVQDAQEKSPNTFETKDLLHKLETLQDDLAKLHGEFIDAQHKNESERASEVKREIKSHLEKNRSLLDELTFESQRSESVDTDLQEWISQHHPFHWFIEFPDVMLDGGFDVVIGNPPFINRGRIKYTYSGFATDGCADIYAPCFERSASLLKDDGRFSMISPISLTSGLRFKALREELQKAFSLMWVVGFGTRPDELFKARVTPVITTGQRDEKGGDQFVLKATNINRWSKSYRSYLFDNLRFASASPTSRLKGIWPFVGHSKISELIDNLEMQHKSIGDFNSKSGEFLLGYKQIASSRFISAFIHEPPVWEKLENNSYIRLDSSKTNWLNFNTKLHRDLTCLLTASRMGHVFWSAISDGFHVTTGVVTWKPFNLDGFDVCKQKIFELAESLDNAQLSNPMVDVNSGKLNGAYEMSKCREITDEADRLILTELGLEEYFPAILLADNWLVKSSDKGATTTYNWPTSWTPTEGPWSPELDDPNNQVHPLSSKDQPS